MNTGVLFDILQHHLDRSSGTWSVQDPRTKKAGRAIFFQNGSIAHAMSAYEGETLADVLVAQGLIAPDRLQMVLDRKVPLSGEVTPADLGHAVEGVAAKVIQGVLVDEMEEGTRPKFDPGGAPSPGAVVINSRNAILLGLLGASRGNYTITLLGPPNQAAILHRAALNGTQIPEDLQWVEECLTPDDAPDDVKRMTLGEIIRRSGRERGRVGGLLYFLREVGAVTFVPVAATRSLTDTGPHPALSLEEPVVQVPEAQAPVAPTPLPEPDEVETALGGLFAAGMAPSPAQAPPLRPPIATGPVAGDIVLEENIVEAEIVEDTRPLSQQGSGMGLVTRQPTMSEIARQWGIKEDGSETMALQVPMSLMERRMAEQKFFLEHYDPALKAFTVPLVVEHKLHGKSLALIMGGIGTAVALGIAAMGLVWVRTERPRILKPGTIKVEAKKGPVGFDPASRVQALKDQELSTALAQGDAYVSRLQSDGKNPYVIRLGLAFQGPDVLKTLNAIGPEWTKEDVFILPIRLDGDKEAYQVFLGTFSEEEVEAAVARLSKLSEAHGGGSVTAYRLREIPRGA